MIASNNSGVLKTGSYANDNHKAFTGTWPSNLEYDDGIVITGQTLYISIDEYACFNPPKFIDEFVPAHMRKNPFEIQIYESILSKHNVCIKNISNNVTFNRQNMRGFY